MFIEEVIHDCDALYPNQYTKSEKYRWCDELGAMLKAEYNKEYETVTLSAENGELLLPPWLGFDMIDRIIVSGREIEKQDFRNYNIFYVPTYPEGRIVFKENMKNTRDVTIIYLAPYDKIRDITIKNINIKTGAGYFIIPDNSFIPNDILTISDGDSIYEDVCVFDKECIEDGVKYTVSIGALPEDEFIGSIERTVTERTPVQPPYDSMYIDYLNAKICYYQRDFDSYNQHIALFNARLNSYEKYLKQRSPLNKGAKLINWW